MAHLLQSIVLVGALSIFVWGGTSLFDIAKDMFQSATGARHQIKLVNESESGLDVTVRGCAGNNSIKLEGGDSIYLEMESKTKTCEWELQLASEEAEFFHETRVTTRQHAPLTWRVRPEPPTMNALVGSTSAVKD